MSNKKLREQILAADDLKLVRTEIPEWGIDEAYLRPLDGDARFRIGSLAADATKAKQNPHVVEAYIVESLCDSDGERIFEWDDREALARKNPVVIERLYGEIVRISGLQAEAEAAAEKK